MPEYDLSMQWRPKNPEMVCEYHTDIEFDKVHVVEYARMLTFKKCRIL